MNLILAYGLAAVAIATLLYDAPLPFFTAAVALNALGFILISTATRKEA